MKNILRQILLLLLAFIQSVLAGGALAVFVMAFMPDSLSDWSNVLFLIIAALFLFITSSIPAKIILKMKGKCSAYGFSEEIYFNGAEGRLRRKKFKNWSEFPSYVTLIWMLLGSVVFLFQLIGVIFALLSLAIPPLHSQVGDPDYLEYPACKFQNIINFLFGFIIGGVHCEEIMRRMDEIMKNAETEQTKTV